MNSNKNTPGVEVEGGFFVGDYEGDPQGDYFGCIHAAQDDQQENGGEIFAIVQLHVSHPWGGGMTWVSTVERASLN